MCGELAFPLSTVCALAPCCPGIGGALYKRVVVYGTRNLRAVDVSVVPVVLQNNTQSTDHAVAERAADTTKVVMD